MSLPEVRSREEENAPPHSTKGEKRKDTGQNLRIFEERDMIHCLLLGFQIDPAACAASGNDPLCRKCSGQEKKTDDPPGQKRCECGQGFTPKSNRQRFCPRCSERNKRKNGRERRRRFYHNYKQAEIVTL